MIFVTKASEKEREELNAKYSLSDYDFMKATDNDVPSALCAVKAEKEILRMMMIQASDASNADLTIRAALAYGDNRNAQECFAPLGCFDEAMKKVGFTEKNGELWIKINRVVHYEG